MKATLLSMTALLSVAITGCSKLYKYDVNFVVRDAKTGQVIENVEIIYSGVTKSVRTDSKGTARTQFRVSRAKFDGDTGAYKSEQRIQFTLRRQGYEDLIVDVTPEKKPKTRWITVVNEGEPRPSDATIRRVVNMRRLK